MKKGLDKGRTIDGWKGVSAREHLNHALGHILASLDDEAGDPLLHCAQAICRTLMAYDSTEEEGRDPIVYLCHRMQDNPDANVQKVTWRASRLMDQYPQHTFITPHVMFPYLKDYQPQDRERLMRYCLRLIDVSDEVWVIDDEELGMSVGMTLEVNHARSMGKMVVHLPPVRK